MPIDYHRTCERCGSKDRCPSTGRCLVCTRGRRPDIDRSPTRRCAHCGGPFTRRPEEKDSDFRKRKYCAITCKPSLAERFWAKVDKNGPTPPHRPELGPCWVWTACDEPEWGYGRFSIAPRKARSSHRVAFFLTYGRWPKPYGLHHCDNPPCCKTVADDRGPAHIYEGTPRDNMQDMHARKRSWQRARTHCPRGHAYDEANTRTYRGKRYCRACEHARIK